MDIDLTGLVLPERIEIADASEDGKSAEFVMEPLERGFGHTLGNSVRRVLLSSLRGAAVWAFRMDGVQHEHQTIPSVVEDVHQVIQNLKSLVVSLDPYVDEATLTISTKKAGPVTAADLVSSRTVEVLNPDHHILTLQGEGEFNAELRVNKGRGFVLADQHDLPAKAPVDLVRIDAIYNPVRRANFIVQETRVGQRTDFDRLIVTVETDGSVEPEWAIRYAAELVRRHLKYMMYFRQGGPPVVKKPEPALVSPVMARLVQQDVDDLTELSVRSRNSLHKKQIRTVRQLVSHTESEMLDINNFGRKSLDEITVFLRQHGLRFGMKMEELADGRLYFVDERPEVVGLSEAGVPETEGSTEDAPAAQAAAGTDAEAGADAAAGTEAASGAEVAAETEATSETEAASQAKSSAEAAAKAE